LERVSGSVSLINEHGCIGFRSIRAVATPSMPITSVKGVRAVAPDPSGRNASLQPSLMFSGGRCALMRRREGRCIPCGHGERRRSQHRTLSRPKFPGVAADFKVLLDDRDVLTEQMYFPDAVNNLSMRTFPPMQGRLNSRAVVNANDRFANFHDPKRLSFGAIKEEHDCYAVSLVLGVDRFAVAQADWRQPAVERPRLPIPASP
jgi:hypothetical protein